jgi:DNA-binding transcriptional LysR family regulator
LVQTTAVRVGFLSGFPVARWGPLFHVLCLEQPGLEITWVPLPLPRQDAPLLADADVGLVLQPPARPGFATLTLDVSPMVLVTAVGDRLAQHHELSVADVVGARFLRIGAAVDREWAAFWTLDAQRGGPPATADTNVESIDAGLEAVASGVAVATTAKWVADGLPHPGVVTIPLIDGPPVETCLVWRADDDRRAVTGLVDLARAWTSRLDERGR